MRYKVYAGTVDVVFKSSTQARFRWKKKTLVYDSYGDAVEGEETEGILTDPVVDLENKEPGTFTCEVPYKAETRFGLSLIHIYGGAGHSVRVRKVASEPAADPHPCLQRKAQAAQEGIEERTGGPEKGAERQEKERAWDERIAALCLGWTNRVQ